MMNDLNPEQKTGIIVVGLLIFGILVFTTIISFYNSVDSTRNLAFKQALVQQGVSPNGVQCLMDDDSKSPACVAYMTVTTSTMTTPSITVTQPKN